MIEFERVLELLKENRPFALLTIISARLSTPRETGSRMLVFPDGKTEFTIGGGILEANAIKAASLALKEGSSRKIVIKLTPRESNSLCGGEVEIFIEVFRSPYQLLILGGGHVGKKIAEVCELINFPYMVADDREEFANRQRFPRALWVLAGDFAGVFDKITVDEKTYIVIVTRGHSFDELCLKKALATPACYIGMIGSKNKVKVLFNNLAKEGLKVRDDPRVYSPIGLKLGDKTPGEIAISILSEILLLKSGGGGEGEGELKHFREA